MSIYILSKSEQVEGAFDGGAILENKPIGFPQESGKQGAYSNIFYWANAWSEQGGLIDIHPHQGFEIMSFVLEGKIVHYDTKNREWLELGKGDVQFIRAGNGIYHAERIEAGGRMFQIWFDPGLESSLKEPASYDDYRSGDFPVIKSDTFDHKILVGEGSPVRMKSQGIGISEYRFDAGIHKLELDANCIYSAYLLDGSIEINGNAAAKDDFVKIEKLERIEIKSDTYARLFVIKSPVRPDYKTYFEMPGR